MNKTKHFRLTALHKSAKSMVSTMLLLIAMLMPQGVWAENFISEVKYGVHSKQSNAKGYLSGYAPIDHDFNNGTDGDWVYIGYKTSTNAADAITGLLVVVNDPESTATTYGDSGFKAGGAKTMMVDGKRYYLAEWGGNADMNNGNKTHKNRVYLYYTKDGNTTNGAQLITTLGAYRGELTTNTTGKNVVPLFGGNGSNTNGTYSLTKLSDFGDTNKGGGGSFNYITYTTHTHSFDQYGICSCGLNHVPSGNGTSASPYEVEYYTDLVYLGNLTRNGNNTFHAIQTKDIDCGGQDIVPMGGYYNYKNYYFKGTYDGGGHVIKNAKYVNNTVGYSQYIGIFGHIASGATIKNLGVVNSTFGGNARIGAVCGQADSGTTIDNCFALNNTITATQGSDGGICGVAEMTITNCYSDNYIRYNNGRSCTNCYSVNPSSLDNYTTKISADDITSGRLCYLINKGKTDGTQVWYQKLGTGAEAYPTPKKDVSKTVYEVAHLKCDGVTKNGSYTYTNNKNITPNVDAHNYSSSFTTDKQATCVQTGSKSKHCSVCDAKTEATTIPALGHGSAGYDENYSWTGNAYNDASKDTKACTFTLTCNKCSTKVVNGASLTCTKTAHVDATCRATGSTTYQATGSYTAANSDYNYSATKTNVYTVAALGHGSTGYTESYVWTGNAYNDASKDTKACIFTLTCKKCSTKVVNGALLTCIKTAHVDASCTATGITTYQATGSYTAANNAYNYHATKTHEYPIAALGHGTNNTGYTPTYTWGGTHDDATCTFTLQCGRCDGVVFNDNITTSKVDANHKDATCTEPGNERWTATGSYSKTGDATYNGTAQTKDYTIPTSHHTFTNKTLTDDPVEDGLYAYACDYGCGARNDAHVIKNYDGEGNNLELTKDGEGNYTAYSVDIVDGKSFFTPVPFTSKIVTMNRTFISSSSLDAAVPATIMLPFSTDGSDLFFTDPYGNLIDGALFYKFNSITRNAETGKWEAIMTHVKDVIQAYTPYIFVGLAQDHLEFGWNFYTMTFPATPAASDMITANAETGWTFVGLNETKRWEEGDQEIGKAYGIAGKDKDYDDYSVHRGDFVKIAAGASAKPGRCYLLKEGSLVSNAKGMTRTADSEELPAVIQLRLINEDGVTGISELNTETGEMTTVQWYDLNGRKIEKPTKKGIYIKNNKKVLVK